MAEEVENDGYITLTDAEGNEYQALYLFDYEDEGVNYSFLVDEESGDVMVGIIGEDDSLEILGPETPEELKNKLFKVLEDFAKSDEEAVDEEIVEDDEEDDSTPEIEAEEAADEALGVASEEDE